MNRRHFFTSTAATAAALSATPAARADILRAQADPAFKTKNNRIHQSIMGWCFKPMDALTLAKHCKDMGLVAMEGIDKAAYKDVMALGLKISLVGSHGFQKGPCNPEHKDFVAKSLIDGFCIGNCEFS